MSREFERMRYALKSISSLCDLAQRVAVRNPEKAAATFEIIKRRVDDALSPDSDDAILKAWEDADLSEEMAHELLGVTRLEARDMLNGWRDRRAVCAQQGHEWYVVVPGREDKCARCSEVKVWREAEEVEA